MLTFSGVGQESNIARDVHAEPTDVSIGVE